MLCERMMRHANTTCATGRQQSVRKIAPTQKDTKDMDARHGTTLTDCRTYFLWTRAKAAMLPGMKELDPHTIRPDVYKRQAQQLPARRHSQQNQNHRHQLATARKHTANRADLRT